MWASTSVVQFIDICFFVYFQIWLRMTGVMSMISCLERNHLWVYLPMVKMLPWQPICFMVVTMVTMEKEHQMDLNSRQTVFFHFAVLFMKNIFFISLYQKYQFQICTVSSWYADHICRYVTVPKPISATIWRVWLILKGLWQTDCWWMMTGDRIWLQFVITLKYLIHIITYIMKSKCKLYLIYEVI